MSTHATITPLAPQPAQGKIAAFFDVDNTIIRGSSAFQLGKGLYERKFFTLRDIVRFTWVHARYAMRGEDKKDMDKVRDRALRIIAGHSVADVIAIGEKVYDEVLTHRIYAGTKKLLDAHIEAGHEVWILSASPLEISSLIAQRLGATGGLGTIAEHVDGIYTGRLVNGLLHGENKAEAAQNLATREGIDLAQSFAYGDSENDIPLLSIVGNPCGINPDLRLRLHCANKGWPTRDFQPHWLRGRKRRRQEKKRAS